MPATLLIHLDEHFSKRLALELRRLGVDVTTTPESGLLTASDRQQLEYADSNGRVMVTCDSDFLALHDEGLPHHGIVYFPMGQRTIGEILQGITLVWEDYEPEEMIGRVEYL